MTREIPMNPNPDILGRIIDRFEVVGREYDGEDNWVGADVKIHIDYDQFFMNIVTKKQYLNEGIEEILEAVDKPEDLLDDEVDDDERPPYVLNDIELTEDVLRQKLLGRTVMSDLVLSLWSIEPED